MAPPATLTNLAEMGSNPAFQPTFSEKLDLIPAFLSISMSNDSNGDAQLTPFAVGSVVYAAISGPFRGDQGANTYKHHITHSLIRKMVTRLNTAQLQYEDMQTPRRSPLTHDRYVAPPFQAVYEKYCKAHNVEPDIVTLKSGVKAFWVGEKTASNICIYFHGPSRSC
jgi:hypothetical protein